MEISNKSNFKGDFFFFPKTLLRLHFSTQSLEFFLTCQPLFNICTLTPVMQSLFQRVMSHSDRSCHSIKSLCCRDFVFVRWLTGESRQRFASLICYHLHVEHTHGSLMLTWNTGSAMCHTSKVQSAKVIPHIITHAPRDALSSCSMSSFWVC